MENSERMAKLLEEELRKVRQGTSDGVAILRFRSFDEVPGKSVAKASAEIQTYNPRGALLLNMVAHAMDICMESAYATTNSSVTQRFDQDGNEISDAVDPATKHRNRAAKAGTN